MRRWFRLLMIGWTTLIGASAHAETYPSRIITLIVPFAAGTGADTIARMIGRSLSEVFRQKVVIENRLGANGAIAASYVARSAPDGHTLFFATNTAMSANPFLMKNLSYDPVRDFMPIARVGSFVFILIINSEIPVTSAQELVAFAKVNPGKLSLGSTTSTSLVAGETLKRLAGVDILIIPQKSGSAVNDVLGGHVSMTITDLTTALPHIQANAVRALAVTSRTRSTLFPDVPSLHEAGLISFDVTPWAGIFAPKDTPKDIVIRLNAELRKIIDGPKVKSELAALGFAAFSSTPEELGEFVGSELIHWKQMINDSGIEAQ